MKTNKILGLVLMVCLVSTLAMAESSDKKETKRTREEIGIPAPGQEGPGVPRVSPVRRRAPMDRRQAYKRRVDEQTNNHKKAIAELEAIKKIAEEENATRTVEALQKMIDKKNAEFKERMQKFESRRREGSKRLQQPAEKPAQKKPAEPTKEKVTEEK